jgi:anhydro-N-acetylmuramic acid kinase
LTAALPRPVAVLNLGGVANITWIGEGDHIVAFDTGPANGLIDAAGSQLSQGARSYDRDGAMAARGRIDPRLLRRLLDHPFFALPPPRSTGKEVFGTAMVAELISDHERAQGDPADLVATLTELTAQSVARAIRQHAPEAARVVASGGGVRNPVLMARLGAALGGIELVTSDAFGIDPDAKEAIAFAVLASLRVDDLPGNLPEATGAARPVLLGRIAEA